MLFQAPKLDAQYLAVIERVDTLRGQLKYALQNSPRRWTGLLRRSTFARAIQGSNSIEGYNVTYEDAVAAVEGEEPVDEKAEAWTAVRHYRDAMSYILQLANDANFVHNEGTIRSLHYMMLSYDVARHPGRWRPGSVFVRNEPSGQIVYEGPDAALVPPLMAELVESLNAKGEMPVMVRAALAHLNLVMIHPFSDGNGRMARALQTFVLAREGILDPTFSSIEEYLGHNTHTYYDVLGQVGQGAWNPEHDTLPWIHFCLLAHYQQAEKLLQRTKQLEKLWNLLEVEVKQRGLNERTLLALSDAALGFRVRNGSYRNVAEVSEQVASRDLMTLVKSGLLLPKGERRGRVYVASPELALIRESVKVVEESNDPFALVDKAQEAKQKKLL
jgi:Fic family protein